MDPKQIAAEATETKPEAWEFMDGPMTGVGVEHWLTNEKACLNAYVCIDQGEVTACEITRVENELTARAGAHV